MNYITIIAILAMLLVIIVSLKGKLTIEWVSLLVAILLAFCGYIYQSGENRKMQDLQYKRDSYANLMGELAVFKTPRMQTAANVEDFTKIYFRSWAETSDEINSLLLKYLQAYSGWTKDKNETTARNEKEAFNALTRQIKKEINPHSTAEFVSYNFGVADTKK